MTPGNWIQLLAIAVTMMLFLMPLIYMAGKLVGKFETMITRLASLENKVTTFQNTCFTTTAAGERMKETDKIQERQWKSIDWLRQTALQICFKVGIKPEDLPKESK